MFNYFINLLILRRIRNQFFHSHQILLDIVIDFELNVSFTSKF